MWYGCWTFTGGTHRGTHIIFACEQADMLNSGAQVLKPSGKIILLQHGRSSWDFLNNILDGDARGHYLRWGCWWNRDILSAVQEVCPAAPSALVIHQSIQNRAVQLRSRPVKTQACAWVTNAATTAGCLTMPEKAEHAAPAVGSALSILRAWPAMLCALCRLT
jgi:hypothetical protein